MLYDTSIFMKFKDMAEKSKSFEVKLDSQMIPQIN